jgi:hypothetical protein
MTHDWAALDAQVLQSPGELVPGHVLLLCSGALDKHVGQESIGRTVLALSLWLWGGMLYIWMIALVFCRYTVPAMPVARGAAAWRRAKIICWPSGKRVHVVSRCSPWTRP